MNAREEIIKGIELESEVIFSKQKYFVKIPQEYWGDINYALCKAKDDLFLISLKGFGYITPRGCEVIDDYTGQIDITQIINSIEVGKIEKGDHIVYTIKLLKKH
jgi:hypothetical protein